MRLWQRFLNAIVRVIHAILNIPIRLKFVILALALLGTGVWWQTHRTMLAAVGGKDDYDEAMRYIEIKDVVDERFIDPVDRSTLVPDEGISIDDGAVAPWNSLMWSLMTDVCRAMGVRTDIPFRDLTDEEKEIVYDGPMVKKHIFYRPKKADTATAGEMDFTYYSATATVLNALNKVKDEKGMKRVEKFLKEDVCPECRGTRLSEKARAPRLMGISLDQACEMTLKDSVQWVKNVPASLPEEMRPMARNICESYLEAAARLMDLGLGYLTLDRASSTLSTGERQRMQLARAVRNRTTGVLYVLDEPSIGLHPANIVGLSGVMHDLVRDGNSVLLVDHDTQILKEADWLIEMGPEAGAKGGTVIAEGTVEQIERSADSVIGRHLSGEQRSIRCGTGTSAFANGEIQMETDRIHTVLPLSVRIPKTALTVITGVSGSGKTTLILESLVPALDALCGGKKVPAHIRSIDAEGIRHVKLIDATPIGINVRSTVATYANVHDELRKIYARTKSAKQCGYKVGDFSYNTGALPAGTHGYGHQYRARILRGNENGKAEAGDIEGPRTRISDARRRNAGTFRRRGAEAQARFRNGETAG